jgi:hypothetical protein
MFEIRSDAKQIERKQHVHHISTHPITSKSVGETTIHMPISALALWRTLFSPGAEQVMSLVSAGVDSTRLLNVVRETIVKS